MKRVTTFEGLPEDAIVHGRRMGNSTRIADHAIQQLFKGYEVYVQDHHQNGRHQDANKFLLKQILRRLSMEHQGAKVKVDGLTIKLL
jgi:menaquinone-dependent protoporphyrinogen IX oxidase